MSTVINVCGLGKIFGARRLLGEVSFAVGERDRIAFVGVNGSGKSTLLKLIAAAKVSTDPADALDEGTVTKRRDLTLEYVAQEPHLDAALSVAETLALGLRAHSEAKRRLEGLERDIPELAGEALTSALEAQAALHERLVTLGGLDREHEVRAFAAALHLPAPEKLVGELSIGERRRVALGVALLARPDVLALDEPTNHLDARTVEWLEGRLAAHSGALLLVTHDRYFLDRVATRILEIDRGRVYAYEGGYSRFIELQAERLDASSERERVRRAFVRRELDWIRRGPQARTTKQQARIDRFDAAVRAGDGQEARPDERLLSLRLPPGPRLGKTVLEAHGVGKSLGGKRLFSGLDLLLKPGERLGIVGPNGAGKTTLIRTLLGLTPPDAGEVVIGVNTRFAFLDQTRSDLDDERSVLEELGGESDRVFLEDGPVHVRSFLRMMLFDDSVAEMRVGKLSGGERNRLQLAKLLKQGGNVLVLDEPTNDLDLITLGVLEAALGEFPGCALVVSHDRWFLDRVATAILAFEADGKLGYYPGNYSDYLSKWGALARPSLEGTSPRRETSEPRAPSDRRGESAPAKAKKLSFKDQRELDGMEGAIEAAEAGVAALEAELSAPDIYARRGAEVPKLVMELDAKRALVERLYARWQELEGIRGG